MDVSRLDIIRFDEKGERISWGKVRISTSTQDAPFAVHSRFEEGEEVWFSTLTYKDGMALIEAYRSPMSEADDAHSMGERKVFLLYPDEDTARAAGWKI